MQKGMLRVGIVGSSSLLGKEVAEELAESVLGVVDIILLDEDVKAGQMTSAGDEPAFIHRIEADSFDRLDLCFFAGSAEETLRHWQAALRAGARIVDLTNALAGQQSVEVWAPWLNKGGLKRSALQPRTQVIIPSHPVAVILALVAQRCVPLSITALAATVLEPASERGSAGVDEMHQQTVSLLSFQPIPRAEFDAQAAFNLLPELGPAARVAADSTARRIQADATAALGNAPALTLQIIHAPVFHGYGLSVLLDFAQSVTAQAVEAALAGDHLQVTAAGEEPPSNAAAAGQPMILARVAPGEGTRLWLWIAADNLKLTALQAIACAAELLGRRGPSNLQ